MTKPTYIAGTLRHYGVEIPAHIPDHAWIFERDTQNLSRNSYAEGRITSVMNFPTFPPEKFHYYRQHGNARLLVSRNRREGQYIGRYPTSIDDAFGLPRRSRKVRHVRAGVKRFRRPWMRAMSAKNATTLRKQYGSVTH